MAIESLADGNSFKRVLAKVVRTRPHGMRRAVEVLATAAGKRDVGTAVFQLRLIVAARRNK
jgi:hypothetical protein